MPRWQGHECGATTRCFQKLVNDTIARPMKSGEFTRLHTTWFLSPIPPRGINLNAPMNAESIDNMKALSDRPAT